MEFEWDPNKRRSNIEKHGIDFAAARQVFAAPYLRKCSDRKGERRWIAIGEVEGQVITVAFCIREDRYRLISARRASKNERREYRSLLP